MHLLRCRCGWLSDFCSLISFWLTEWLFLWEVTVLAEWCACWDVCVIGWVMCAQRCPSSWGSDSFSGVPGWVIAPWRYWCSWLSSICSEMSNMAGWVISSSETRVSMTELCVLPDVSVLTEWCILWATSELCLFWELQHWATLRCWQEYVHWDVGMPGWMMIILWCRCQWLSYVCSLMTVLLAEWCILWYVGANSWVMCTL